MNDGLTSVSEGLADVVNSIVSRPPSRTADDVRAAVKAIANKVSIAAHYGNKDFTYELARTMIGYIAGAGALHEVEEMKTPHSYDWAIDQIANALEL
jgi:hypothetical protein